MKQAYDLPHDSKDQIRCLIQESLGIDPEHLDIGFLAGSKGHVQVVPDFEHILAVVHLLHVNELGVNRDEQVD